MNKIYVCIPSGHFTMAVAAYSQAMWLIKNNVYLFEFYISNRVDRNRSECLQHQKEYKADMIMLDSDVVPLQSLDEIKKLIEEDMTKYGCQIIIAPLWSPLNTWIIDPPPKDNTPYEVNGGSLGFVFIPYEVAMRMTPVSLYGSFGNQGSVPMYFRYTEINSEDSDFIMRMKLQGIKVCADPRIKVTHMKYVTLTGPLETEKIKAIIEKLGETAIVANETVYIPLGVDSFMMLTRITEEDNKLKIGLIQIQTGSRIYTLGVNVTMSPEELKKMIEKYKNVAEKLKSLPPDAQIIGDEVIYDRGKKREKL